MSTDVPVIDRTVYVVVNTSGLSGALAWDEDRDNLPTFHAEQDKHYRVNLPSTLSDQAVTDAFDAFLGDYDLPEGWEVGPV